MTNSSNSPAFAANQGNVAEPSVKTPQHSRFDDVQAIITGALLVALAVYLFKSAGLLVGGTAGAAFLVSYSTEWSFGLIFFVINLPFYVLAIRKMGVEFTVKTFISVFLVSAFSELTPKFIQLDAIEPLYAAIVGGGLLGAGILMLLRHNASLGGFNILARYLSQKYGISFGKFQMSLDCAVVGAAFFVVSPSAIVASIIGAVALNFVLAVNHKPGRYLGL